MQYWLHKGLNKLLQIKYNPDMISIRKSELEYVDINSLTKELHTIEQSIENLTTALAGNTESSAASYIIKQIEKLDKSKRKLEDSLCAAEYNNQISQNEKEAKDIIYNYICSLLDNFESMSYREKNELVKKTVKQCVFDDDGLHIIF